MSTWVENEEWRQSQLFPSWFNHPDFFAQTGFKHQGDRQLVIISWWSSVGFIHFNHPKVIIYWFILELRWSVGVIENSPVGDSQTCSGVSQWLGAVVSVHSCGDAPSWLSCVLTERGSHHSKSLQVTSSIKPLAIPLSLNQPLTDNQERITWLTIKDMIYTYIDMYIHMYESLLINYWC